MTNVTEQDGDNHGQMVELFLRGVGLSAGAPWCAAFVHHIGYWSQFDAGLSHSAWPLPATGSCRVLGDAAAQRNVLMSYPWRGDVFLMYFTSLSRFAHTGIVLDVRETKSAFLCTTIEGNTNDDGGRDGWKSCIKQRVFGKADGHAFIRWTALIKPPSVSTLAAGESITPTSAEAA
jgi:hypothetical protein